MKYLVLFSILFTSACLIPPKKVRTRDIPTNGQGTGVSKSASRKTEASGEQPSNKRTANPTNDPAGTIQPERIPDASIVDSQLTHCASEPPICIGGLLPQTATAKNINDYVAKYPTNGCRYIQPPRCALNKNLKPIRSCIEECTP